MGLLGRIVNNVRNDVFHPIGRVFTNGGPQQVKPSQPQRPSQPMVDPRALQVAMQMGFQNPRSLAINNTHYQPPTVIRPPAPPQVNLKQLQDQLRQHQINQNQFLQAFHNLPGNNMGSRYSPRNIAGAAAHSVPAVATSVGQGFLRSGARAGISGESLVAQALHKPQTPYLMPENVPGGKKLFGSGVIQSYQQEHSQHGGGLPGLAAVGLSAASDAPIGFGKGSLIKNLTKTTTAADAARILTKAGVHADVVKLAAPSIAKATKPAEVQGILQATHEAAGVAIPKKLAPLVNKPNVPQKLSDQQITQGINDAHAPADAKHQELINYGMANADKLAVGDKATIAHINKLQSEYDALKKTAVQKAKALAPSKPNVPEVPKGAANLTHYTTPENAKPPKVATKPAAKVGIKAPPKNPPMIIPQASSEGRLSRLTSLQNRLNNLGGSGKEALQTIRNQIVGNRMYVQQFKDMAQPFYKLTPEEQAVAIKVHKGTAKTADSNIQAGANALKGMFQHIHATATSKGLKVGDLGPNYFPDTFPKDWFNKPENFNKAVQDLVSSGKASSLEDAVSKINKVIIQGSTKPHEFGNFMTREKNLPTGIESADVVSNYIKGSAKRISEAEHFGVGGQALNKHVADAVANGEDAGALKKIISSYINPARPKPGLPTKALNAYQKALRVIQLPRAAISHGPQGFTNTASDIGYTKYFKSLGSKVFKDPETERLVNKSGVNAEDFGKTDNLSGKATAPGLAPMLRFHRDVAFRGGMSMAQGLAKKGDVAGLTKLGVDGKFVKSADGSIKLTDEQLIKAGHFEADKSIGSHSLLESPDWVQTNGGKLVGMYRKMYTFKQAERIANLFKDARAGDVAPLARFLVIGAPVAGLGVAVAKDEIKDPGSNPFSDKRKLALDTLHNSGIGSIGYGLVDSVINGVSHNYGNDSRWSNVAGAISPGLGFAVQTGQNTAKAVHGNVKPLEREGLRMSPVGGTALANKFAPSTYTPPDPNQTSAAEIRKAAMSGASVSINGKPTPWNSLTEAQRKTAAGSDPVAKAFYEKEQAMKVGLRKPGVYPDGVSPESAHTLDIRNRLTTKGWNTLVNSHNDAEYMLNQAKYEQDKANGKLNTAQDIKAQDALAKDKVGADYTKNVRDLYTLSKAKIYKYITSAPDGNALADQLGKYDQALKDAGIITTAKFKYGFAPKVATGSSRSTGVRGSRSSGAKVATLKVKLPPKPKKVTIGKLPSATSAKAKSGFKTPRLATKKPKKIKFTA